MPQSDPRRSPAGEAREIPAIPPPCARRAVRTVRTVRTVIEQKAARLRTRFIAAALAAVVLGAIIRSGSASPGSGTTWTVGLSMMLAGTAGLTAVLLQTMTGLRRATERRRAQPSASGPRTPRLINPTQGSTTQTSSSAALCETAVVYRYPDAAAENLTASRRA